LANCKLGYSCNGKEVLLELPPGVVIANLHGWKSCPILTSWKHILSFLRANEALCSRPFGRLVLHSARAANEGFHCFNPRLDQIRSGNYSRRRATEHSKRWLRAPSLTRVRSSRRAKRSHHRAVPSNAFTAGSMKRLGSYFPSSRPSYALSCIISSIVVRSAELTPAVSG
jgi:hypothetical protein